MDGSIDFSDILRQNKLDALFVTNPYNILYLTSFKGASADEREAFVLLTRNKLYLFVDPRQDIAQINNDPKDNLEVKWITPDKRLMTHLTEIIKEESIKKIGFEEDNLTVVEYNEFKKKLRSVTFVPTRKIISSLRIIKKDWEIERIKKACELSSQCLTEIAKTIVVGQTEKEISWKIEKWVKEHGYELAFESIVAADENAAIPHYCTKDGAGRLQTSSVLLIDFGVKYRNYCSDMTRVLFMGGATREARSVYEKLLSAQEKTIDEIPRFARNNGGRIKQVDEYCRELLQKDKLPNIPHSVGHGVGLEVHEAPYVSFRSKETLIPSQIITIEPGVYMAGKYGMRIEDTILVGENQEPTILTTFPKKLQILS